MGDIMNPTPIGSSKPRHMIEHPINMDAPDGFVKEFIPVPTLQNKELQTNRRILRGNKENKNWINRVIPEVFNRTPFETGGPRRGTSPFSPPINK